MGALGCRQLEPHARGRGEVGDPPIVYPKRDESEAA
jgi:hypothetical protein